MNEIKGRKDLKLERRGRSKNKGVGGLVERPCGNEKGK